MDFKGFESTILELVHAIEPHPLDIIDIKIHKSSKLCDVGRGL